MVIGSLKRVFVRIIHIAYLWIATTNYLEMLMKTYTALSAGRTIKMNFDPLHPMMYELPSHYLDMEGADYLNSIHSTVELSWARAQKDALYTYLSNLSLKESAYLRIKYDPDSGTIRTAIVNWRQTHGFVGE